METHAKAPGHQYKQSWVNTALPSCPRPKTYVIKPKHRGMCRLITRSRVVPGEAIYVYMNNVFFTSWKPMKTPTNSSLHNCYRSVACSLLSSSSWLQQAEYLVTRHHWLASEKKLPTSIWGEVCSYILQRLGIEGRCYLQFRQLVYWNYDKQTFMKNDHKTLWFVVRFRFFLPWEYWLWWRWYRVTIHKMPRLFDINSLPLLSMAKMATFSQTIFSDAFSWMNNFVLRLKFRWRLFLRVQLTITQHWFR